MFVLVRMEIANAQRCRPTTSEAFHLMKEVCGQGRIYE